MTTITSSDLRPRWSDPAAPALLSYPPAIDRLVRAEDQLRLTIEFLNLDVDPRTNLLVRVDRTEPFTGVRLVFGSQHTVEDTISTSDATPIDGVRPPDRSRLAARVRAGGGDAVRRQEDPRPRRPGAVAGRPGCAIPAREAPATSRPRRRGRRPSGAIDTEPVADVTALEVVDSLVFSPDPDGRFTAAAAPITRDDVTELWRARMEEGGLRAIYSRPGDPPFERPLAEDKRRLIVDATVTDPGDPIQVDRLWLTSQGCVSRPHRRVGGRRPRGLSAPGRRRPRSPRRGHRARLPGAVRPPRHHHPGDGSPVPRRRGRRHHGRARAGRLPRGLRPQGHLPGAPHAAGRPDRPLHSK